jgi:hypothetical protein
MLGYPVMLVVVCQQGKTFAINTIMTLCGISPQG